MAIPVIASVSTAAESITTDQSIDVTVPSGIAAGDLLLIVAGHDAANPNRDFEAITSESGWTLHLTAGGSTPDTYLGVYTKKATGSEATVTVPFDGISDHDAAVIYCRITGADADDPIDVMGTAVLTASASSHTLTGVTTTVDDCLAFFAINSDGIDSSPFSVAGSWSVHTEKDSDTAGPASGCALAVGTLDKATAGATGDAVVTPTTTDGATGVCFAIAPAAASGVEIPVGAGSAAVTGYAPTPSPTAHHFVDVSVGSATFSGLAPTPSTKAENHFVDVSAGAIAVTGYAPTPSPTENHFVDVAVGAAIFAGYAPTPDAEEDVTVEPGLGAATFSGYAPTPSPTEHHFVDVATGAAVFAGAVPTLSLPVSIDVGVGAATFSGATPALDFGLAVATGAATLTGQAPTLNLGLSVGTGAIAFTGYAPVDVTNLIEIPAAGALTFAGQVPYVAMYIKAVDPALLDRIVTISPVEYTLTDTASVISVVTGTQSLFSHMDVVHAEANTWAVSSTITAYQSFSDTLVATDSVQASIEIMESVSDNLVAVHSIKQEFLP